MNDKELKKWFDTWATEQPLTPLPTDHAARFERRLKKHNARSSSSYFLRAAVLLALLGLIGMASYFSAPAPPEVVQFKEVENHFFQRIEAQLEELQQSGSPSMQKMIQHSRVQLDQMQSDYVKLHTKWEENPLQPQLINALIENLKRQSELLEHIQYNILKLQNFNYENL